VSKLICEGKGKRGLVISAVVSVADRQLRGVSAATECEMNKVGSIWLT
jgi:hypothetical protein